MTPGAKKIRIMIERLAFNTRLHRMIQNNLQEVVALNIRILTSAGEAGNWIAPRCQDVTTKICKATCFF